MLEKKYKVIRIDARWYLIDGKLHFRESDDKFVEATTEFWRKLLLKLGGDRFGDEGS